MRKIKLLLLVTLAIILSVKGFAQVNVDIGKDWDPDTQSIISATSGTFFVPSQLEYIVNQGTDNEVMFIAGGASTAANNANNSTYANPAPESFSHIQIGVNQSNGTWFEVRVTGSKVISSIKLNGTSGGLNIPVTGGILYSDQSSFDGNNITDYGEVPFAAVREGNAGVIIDNVPANTRSFRIYNPAKIAASGSAYALATEGDVVTVGDAAQSFRVCYVSVTLVEGPPPTTPSLTKVSGDAEQTFYLGQPVSDIVYRWGGTATSASVTWAGGSTPDGISVTPDADAKTLTISGTPAAAGEYSFSVVATDGSQTTTPLTGKITVNNEFTGKKRLAYVTTLADPVDPADVVTLALLRETFDVDIVIANEAGDASKPASTFDPYDAIVLAALPGSGTVPNCLKNIDKPLVSLKPFMFQAANSNCWDWGAPINLHGSSLADVPTGVAVSDASHPLFKGMGLSNGSIVPLATGSKHGNFRILTPIYSWHGSNEANITTLATVPAGYNYSINPTTITGDATDKPVIFVVNPNSVMVNGSGADVLVPNIQIHIGVSEQAANTAAEPTVPCYTPELLTIIKNAVDYALQANPGSVVYEQHFNNQEVWGAADADVIPQSCAADISYIFSDTNGDVIVNSGTANSGNSNTRVRASGASAAPANANNLEPEPTGGYVWLIPGTITTIDNGGYFQLPIQEGVKEVVLYARAGSTGTFYVGMKFFDKDDNPLGQYEDDFGINQAAGTVRVSYTVPDAIGATPGGIKVRIIPIITDATRANFYVHDVWLYGKSSTPTAPTLFKASGAETQNVLVNTAMSEIVYRWGGSATSANVSWTGGSTPAGITVTPDNTEKTLTIAGTPTAAGVYGFQVTATDGANTTAPLTGTISVTSVADPVVEIAYNAATNVKTVSITCETAGAEIYYTTDGTEPTKASTRYSAPFEMTAESFTIRARAWDGETSSVGFGEKSWSDPFVFNPASEYFIYSFGSNEGRNADEPKYLYAASEGDLRWIEVNATGGEELSTVLANTDLAKWKLSAGEDNSIFFRNKTTNQFIVRGSLTYNSGASSIASAIVGAEAESFYVAYKADDKEKRAYSIQVVEPNQSESSRSMEVNGTVNDTDIELANTVQFNNGYADRARFRWVIETVPGTGINLPGFNKEISNEQYFDIMGRPVSKLIQGAVMIRKVIYTDGTVEAQKVFVIK